MKTNQKPWALVTGASKRLGKAITEELSTLGYSIIIHCQQSITEAKSLSETLKQSNCDSFVWQCDLSLIGDVIAGMEELKVSNRFPSLIVHSASIFEGGSLGVETTNTLNSPFEFHQFQMKLFQVNLHTPIVIDQMFLEYWETRSQIEQNSEEVSEPKTLSEVTPEIIYMLDQRILKNSQDKHVYNLSKKSLNDHFLQMSLGHGDKIKINAVAPGLILPPPGIGNQHLIDRQHLVPRRMHGGIQDIKSAVKYLIKSPFVHGQILYCDGGEHL